MSVIVKMLSERKRMKHVGYELAFTIIGGDDDGCGFGFPCTKDGTLIHDEYYDCWIENYKICVDHPEKFEPDGIKEISWWYTEPAHARCSCGEEILLQGDTCCPNCGQWYNGFGQALRDPEFKTMQDAFLFAGYREKHAMDNGNREIKTIRGHKCFVFTYPLGDEYQDANGATYDTVTKEWID